MKNKLFVLPVLALGVALSAQAQGAPSKVGVINIQGAIVTTKDGQKAASELETKSAPKRKELETKQNEITQLKDQLQKGQNTLSEATKAELYKNIDAKTKILNRDVEDAQAEFDQDQQKILQQLGQKMMAVIDKYAKDNGYTLILDVSSPQTPVLYASNTIDVTKDIIDLYDKNSTPASPSAPAAARPATPAAPRPAATPPPKPKQ
ncbi:MAG: OmpH family outer membrane protein [Acidobacteriota bacterium]|nr:OmpH family outer membrane protein [Acidobacteriota bacterium]